MRLYARNTRAGRVWWASWSEPHPHTGRTVTRRRSTGCSTKSAAEIVVERWERERADPIYAAANEATFGDEAARFLRACEGAVERKKMTPETLGMYRQKAGTLTRILTAELRLAAIDGDTFVAYISARRDDFRESTGKAIKESTLFKEWVAFHGILRQAWRGSRFGRDPKSLKPPNFGPEYTPRTTALSWSQVKALLIDLAEVRRKPVAFALAFGARRREVFRAESGDIGTETVRIRGTKTEIADAVLPIVSLMADIAEQAKEPPYAPWPNARRDLAAACARLGLPRVTWNDLRRTFASLLVQAGVAPHLVAKLLRHKTTAMVDRVYGRQTTESLGTLIEDAIRRPPVNHKPQDPA